MRYVTGKATWVDALMASLREGEPRGESDKREVLRIMFDEDAGAYDRSRPVAPGDVFDDALARASLLPGSTVVEIGPGTGQATRQLAQRGLQILALELGPQLADRARTNLAEFPNVTVVTAAFEEWDPGDDAFDSVFACNSFHWVDPDVRFVKAAQVLSPSGHLVVLSTPWVIPTDADRFWWDVQEDWEAIGAERVDPSSKHPDRILDLGPAVRASGVFEEPTMTRRIFDRTFTTDEYAMNLSTQSVVKELPTDVQTELVERVTKRIQQRGGLVTAHLLAMLTVTRRAQ
jgi:SAM-dependent methyltransferase